MYGTRKNFYTIFFLSSMAILFFSGIAWATSASISVSGSEGAIPVYASASFSTYQYCDGGDPPSCWTQNNGFLTAGLDGGMDVQVYGEGSANWMTTVDGGGLSQGVHTFSATATDSIGVSDTATKSFTIDNTPSVTVSSPGQVEGAFEIAGSATFKEHVHGPEGEVQIWIDEGKHGYRFYEGTGIDWSYSDIIGHKADAGPLAQGEHSIAAYAIAYNGATAPVATGTFTVDNTPTVTINSPGKVSGEFDITGSATFKEHVYGIEGEIQLYIDGTHYGTHYHEGTSIDWSYSGINGYMLNADDWAQGEHSIEVHAIALNGAKAPIATGTFMVGGPDDPKNMGQYGCPRDAQPYTDNPINFSIGNKFQTEIDFALKGPGLPFGFTRYYNSRSNQADILGFGWKGTFSDNLRSENDKMILLEADGAEIHFIDTGQGQYLSEAEIVRMIEPLTYGYRLLEPDGKILVFDNGGKLTQITDRNGNSQTIVYTGSRLTHVEDNFGRRIDFIYDIDGRLNTLETPAGSFTYSYDAQGNLSTVTNPELFQKTYLYEDSNDPNNLTGIVNERGIRSGTYVYDDQDRAVRSEGAEGQNRIEVSYDTNFVRHITNSKGHSTDYTLHVEHGIARIKSSTSEGCPSCSGSIATEYDLDDKLWINSATDAKGIVTTYTYDSHGNILIKTEASGTPEERSTIYTYLPEYNLVESITKESIFNPGQAFFTSFIYDSNGNLLQKTQTGFSGDTPFLWITAYAYNSFGQITTIDGPRTDINDIITFEYYSNDPGQGLNRAMLKRIINPLGHETIFSQFNSFGKPGQIIDANGVVTIHEYGPLGRLISTTTAGITTTSEYDAVGNLKALNLPEGRTISYAYTSAGLLEKVEDNLENHVLYSYDTEGNRIKEEIHDPDGTLKKFTDFEFDTYNRLSKTVYPGNGNENRGYDLNGNLTSLTDANNNTTVYGYDELNRLVSVTQPGNVTTANIYDSDDNLISVTEGENHTTTYTYDDAGRMIATMSPDTGTTTYSYDAAGNLTSKTDANGNTITYDYDELNRLTGIHFPDSSQDITYTYDQGTNGKGRLTAMSDPSGDYNYSYDALGNLIQEDKSINGVTYTTEYTYDAAGVLIGVTYPNGRTVSYQIDSAGRVFGITTEKDGIIQTVAQNITYLPFGPMTSLAFGNGKGISQTFDQLYRPAGIVSGTILDLSYTTDAVGSITAIADNLDDTKNRAFQYDGLNRLTQATGIFGTIDYTYDNVGNRLSRSLDGQTDTYQYQSGNNRLSQITGTESKNFSYDANGNTTSLGDQTFSYSQNDRLIKVTENSNIKSEYLYNGNGQRVKKESGGATTIFHYDRLGNLIGESTPDGSFTREYVYLNGMRLAAFAGEVEASEITVNVGTDDGKALSGIKVYAFTEAGSYTGKYAITDEDGNAEFAIADFTDGNYKFRADYLSEQFWSAVATFPGTYSIDIEIEEEAATIVVTQGIAVREGVKVYLFNSHGSYLGRYEITDENGEVTFDLPAGMSFKFRADTLGSQYFSDAIEIASGETNYYVIDVGGGTLVLTLDKGDSTPLVGIKAYLFNESGSYLGLWDQTDDQGIASYSVSSGRYKIRADYMGYQFWTDIIDTVLTQTAILSIPHNDITITVAGDLNGNVQPRENLKTYLFTPTGSYLGKYEVTDSQGLVIFNLPEKDYKIRADYLSQQFWSDVFNATDETVTIEEGMAAVVVSSSGIPIEGVKTYVFNSAGSYLGLYAISDAEGKTEFRLPEGDYNFRADYIGNQYWSGVTTLIAHTDNPIVVSTGGGAFTATILKGSSEPLVGVKCYLFNETGSYLGKYGTTNGSGEVSYDIADGSYKIRIDCMGYKFWTDVFNIPGSLSITHNVPHHDNTVTVACEYDGDILPGDNLKAYLFTPTGSYLGRYEVTDDLGQAIFNLPERNYKIRADYLSQQFWSEVFNSTDTPLTIEEGLAEIEVLQGASPLSNVKVYAFNSANAYLGIYETTNGEGKASFRLPAASYKFRADHQSSQYWATETILPHQVNPITLTTGGGSFELIVEKETGIPMTGIKVYVFSPAGSYLGMYAVTDDQGMVSFDLSDGTYMFRADYLGYQFWTDVYAVPDTLNDTYQIPHQGVTITVNRVYGDDVDHIENIKAYLFKSSGSYLGKYATTDSNGQVKFSLPEKDFKVRADYMSSQFWSDTIYWQDENIDIDHGKITVHVTDLGMDIESARVYLFTDTGSYLGKYENTDGSGSVSFTLPIKAYKFRVDFSGSQYWSDTVTPIAHDELNVDLELDLLALQLTNDPNPVKFDGVPIEHQPDGIMLASIGSITDILTNSIVAQTPEPKIYYYLNDHLGTPMKVIDESNTVVWSADYTPFGDANITIDAFKNNFRFPGQHYDQESGLHYNYQRYYIPATGRYLTPDPIGLAGGINLYTYVQNDPANLVDPEGLEVLLIGRNPLAFRFNPRLLRPGQRYIPRNISKESNAPQPRYTPTAPRDPVPYPSWLARFLKTLSDLLGGGDAGNSGFAGIEPSSGNQGDPCSGSSSQGRNPMIQGDPNSPNDPLFNPGGYT